MAMLSHRPGWSWAVFLSIFPFVFNGKQAQTQSFTYHANSSEVRITFFATDENNRPIENLTKDDFAVVDNGVIIRDFRSLARSDETSFHIVALVDSSGSVAAHSRETLRQIVHLASPISIANDDTLSIVSFSGLQPQLLCTSDCLSSAAETNLVNLKAAGPTPLFDTLVYAAHFMSDRHTPGVRDVMILFSDGEDTISVADSEEALAAVLASGALLYTVDMGPSANSRGGKALQQMAALTGGRFFPLHDDTANVLQTVLVDLRSSYIVTYRLPSRITGFHSLSILPKHNLNLHFHCRGGYEYEAVP